MPDAKSLASTKATRIPRIAAARVVLRVAPEVVAPRADVAGVDLAGPINPVRGTAERFAARLGPDEWLLVAPLAEEETLAAALDAALADVFHSAVEVSRRDAALTLEGPAAADVLNAGTPLDLADAAFPAGAASRTVFGKAEITLLRPADGRRWRVECARSFAPYVVAFLEEAAR